MSGGNEGAERNGRYSAAGNDGEIMERKRGEE